MSTETPTTAEIRNRHNSAAKDINEKIELDQIFGRWLATVRPNQDDARQVEVGAAGLCVPDHHGSWCEFHGRDIPVVGTRWCSDGWHDARAVLAALAEAGDR